jgi:hypothetical protein
MGAIATIDSYLNQVAGLVGIPYYRGRDEDMNPVLNVAGVTYPLVWCFPISNTGELLESGRYNKTVQISLIFMDISQSNIDRTAQTDKARTIDCEDIADEFIVRFNDGQTFGFITSISGSELPLYNKFSSIISAYTLVFNLNITTGVCYD